MYKYFFYYYYYYLYSGGGAVFFRWFQMLIFGHWLDCVLEKFSLPKNDVANFTFCPEMGKCSGYQSPGIKISISSKSGHSTFVLSQPSIMTTSRPAGKTDSLPYSQWTNQRQSPWARTRQIRCCRTVNCPDASARLHTPHQTDNLSVSNDNNLLESKKNTRKLTYSGWTWHQKSMEA